MLKIQTKDIEGTPYAVMRDGKPLYIEDTNNTEVAYDAEASSGTIKRLNQEAQRNREAKEAAEQKVAAFGEIDPEAAKAALQTVADLDSGALLTADKVAELRTGITASVEKRYTGDINTLKAQLQAKTESEQKLTQNLHSEKLSNAFATSKYVGEKMSIPAQAAQKIFGDQFKIEEGKIVAYDANGQKMFSQARPGQDPDFDEAIELVVGSSSYRDSILKGKGQNGGGGSGGSGGGGGILPNVNGKTQMTRKEFASKTPLEQMKIMQDQKTVVVDEPKAA